ncbi:DNA polymerase III subunit delta [Gemmatimonadota bacterium DH-20]|uniref:DNA polymerase III subunit delta n=1 Tax=Gaopeijia maritima TaxID=3119007 RepID=A0ABU9ECE4_9BACT
MSQKKSGGVVFYHGEDAFRREEAVRAFIDAHVDPGLRDFNLDQLRGNDVDVDQLASTLATPPMMSDFRVVVIRDAEPLAGSPRARKLLLETAAAPPPGLAFVISADASESKAKFWKELKKAARATHFRAVSLEDLPGWLVDRAESSLGMTLEHDAARALAQAVGSDLGILQQELAKLNEYVEGDRPVTREDVAAVGTTIPAQDRWDWIDLVAARRFDDAAARLPILLAQQGESGVGITLGLGTMLLRLGVVADEGPRALEKLLPPYQNWLSGKLARLARSWTATEIEDALLGLLRVDRLLKSSPLSDDLVIEEWLLGLEARRREAA